MLLNGPQFATKETIDILEITQKHATVLQKTVPKQKIKNGTRILKENLNSD